MKNAIGHHVWLRCLDWEASEVLAAHLDQLIELLNGAADPNGADVRLAPPGDDRPGWQCGQ